MKHTLLLDSLAKIFLLFLFSLPALSPLFSPTLTRSADGLLHLYRLVQLDALWHSGIFFSRWLPDLAFGYGMPLFNYYAPLVYYLTTPFHSLGISFSRALNVSLAAALFTGAAGMFFFSRALFQQLCDERAEHRNRFVLPAALVSALAFLYAPYILFNALYRANLAEQWALAFAPFALWQFFVLIQKPSALNWALAVLFFATVMLSHNVTSFLFAPLLFLFVAASVIASSGVRERLPRKKILAPISAFLVALMLSALFWLPALVERDFVQIARVIVTPDFDYRFNFVSPTELIALLPRADRGRMNPAFPSTLGIVQILLASAGIIFLFWKIRSRRALPFFALAFAACGFIVLMLSISQPLWDSVSLLSFVQLPMRLRGLVALCLAPFVGIFVFALPTRWQTLGAGAAIIAIVLSALPMLYPRYARDVSPNPNLPAMFAYEQKSGAFGTTSFGEYLPVWAQHLPDQSPFAEDYADSAIPNRFEIPEGVNVCGEQLQALSQTICVEANDSWHALYRAFYFPGWRVTLDGAPLEISPTPRTGLISFEVEKSGMLRVEYVGTQLEQFAQWVTLASAILVLGVLVFGLIQSARQPRPNFQPSTFNFYMFLTLGALALALLAFKIIYVDRVSNPFVAQYDSARVENISHTRTENFGQAMQLLGFEVNASEIARGETLRTILYWRARAAMQNNLSVFVHLTAPDGFVVAQQDNLHPAKLPTSQWDLDAYAADEHAFEIPDALASGEYELRAGVYDARTGVRLNASDGRDFVLLQKIFVK